MLRGVLPALGFRLGTRNHHEIDSRGALFVLCGKSGLDWIVLHCRPIPGGAREGPPCAQHMTASATWLAEEEEKYFCFLAPIYEVLSWIRKLNLNNIKNIFVLLRLKTNK